MAHALEATCEAVPKPKLLILFGACAISGGIFQGSGARREFIEKHKSRSLFSRLPAASADLHPRAAGLFA